MNVKEIMKTINAKATMNLILRFGEDESKDQIVPGDSMGNICYIIESFGNREVKEIAPYHSYATRKTCLNVVIEGLPEDKEDE